MKTRVIHIEKQEDFLEHLEKFNLSWTSSLSNFVRGALQYLHEEGTELVVFRFADDVIRKSYWRSSTAKEWVKKSLIGKVPYPFLQNSHPYGEKTLVITASMYKLEAPKFLTRIVQRLKDEPTTRLYFSVDEIPPIYKKQPYLLRTYLRRKGFKNATTAYVGNTILITYERPESKTATVHTMQDEPTA